jgi:hypothetical protein
MPVAAALGEKLLDFNELDSLADADAHGVTEFLDGADIDDTFEVTIGGTRAIGPTELARAREARSPKNPYQGIGLGKPLTITIERIYVGDYPDALPWVPGFNLGDILVTSAHKAFQSFEAAPRAVHLLEPRAALRSSLKAKAVGQGSQLVFYSPAVADFSILFSVELSADRDFDKELGAAFAKAVTAAGALPVFASAAPFLIAAGTAIPIAFKAANLLARPNVFYQEHVELNFARPGVALAQPGALVLYPGGDDRPFVDTYSLGDDFHLRHVESGDRYAGQLPYVVISLDGTERPDLKTWSAHAASASLVERFYEPDELMTRALDIVTAGMTLYNDMEYRQKAAAELAQAKASTGEERKQHQVMYAAYRKNIQSEAIRTSLAED